MRGEASGVPWRAEPFRLFFPLGVVLGAGGVGHWLTYATGLTATYSCQLHGLLQTQGFMVAFALGFLLTAVPRRTGTPPPSPAMLGAAAALLLVTAAGLLTERWLLGETAYAALLVLLAGFALRRFGAPGARRPPASFVLVPVGLLHGLGGAGLAVVALTGAGAPHLLGLAKLLIEQGVFLCLTIGVGGLLLPLIGGRPAPADAAGAAATRRVWAWSTAGIAIFATLVAEHAGWGRAAPLARAAVVAAGLAAAGAGRGPLRPGFHRRLVWLAVWLMPLGLAFSGLAPDYRVPALHVLFIGGFGLLVFAVATHVSLGHLGLDALASGRPAPVVALAAAFLLAMAARLAADWSDSYFDHLGWAAACWIAGSAVWLGFLGPRLLRR
jgi:uncharacterized protein involved in response to NO